MISPARPIRLWLGICLRSTRWQVRGSARSRRLLTTAHQGTVVAFWHRSLTLSPALWFWARRIEPALRLRVLISRNRDGQLISQTVRPWDIIGIHGSSGRKGKDKGGASVLRVALKELRNGALVAITPDGPRGPAEQVQPGTVALSRLAKCAVVPMGLSCSGLRLPSWDGLAFPLPFGHGAMVAGAPLFQPDAETLQDALRAVSQQADILVQRQKRSLADRLWHLTGTLLAPALTIMLRIRLHRGKEIRTRLRERMGLGAPSRPAGPLLWVHAASVGETLSALPLVEALLQKQPDLHVLFTTATVTGSDIVARHASSGDRLIHQFIPHDVPRWVRRFLKHWRPDGVVFVESELWPGMVSACYRRGIPVMLVNGRLSDCSARRWARVPRLAKRMLSRLAWVAARGPEDALRFRALGASPVFEDGDLKQDAPPLPYDEKELARLKALIGSRPVFVAASTHPGEETLILAAAARARRTQPDLLTIIVPRHPVRGAELAAEFGLPRRSTGATPDAATPVWLADTLGELGLFYRLADRCLIGNSLCGNGGGHNPFEPLRLGTSTATGPLMQNWRDAMSTLSGVVHSVQDMESLAQWIVTSLPAVTEARCNHPVVNRLRDRILGMIEE